MRIEATISLPLFPDGLASLLQQDREIQRNKRVRTAARPHGAQLPDRLRDMTGTGVQHR
jgi:hypothetical protein